MSKSPAQVTVRRVGVGLAVATVMMGAGEVSGPPKGSPELAAVAAIKLLWMGMGPGAALVTLDEGPDTWVALVPTGGEILDVQSPTFNWIKL